MLALNFASKKDFKKWISLKIISLKKVALFIHSPYYSHKGILHEFFPRDSVVVLKFTVL